MAFMENERKHKITLRIPLAVTGMLLAQASGILIWATQLDARVAGIEQQGMNGRNLNEKFAALETRLDDVREGMGDIKRQIAQLTQNLLKK